MKIPQPTQKVPTHPKKQHWIRVILITISVIISLAIFPFLTLAILNTFSTDIHQINDSDLKVKIIAVPQKDNAYFDLIKLNKVPENEFKIIQNMITSKKWDDKTAKDILSRNTHNLTYFAKAANKPYYQDQNSINPLKATTNDVPAITYSMTASRLSVLRAIYLAKQGKDKEAIEEALNSVKVGQNIQKSQSADFFEYLMGSVIKYQGLEAIQKILPTTKLNSNDLKAYAKTLDEYSKNEELIITILKNEYRIQAHIVDESSYPLLETYKLKNTFNFKPNETKLLFANSIRESIKQAKEPYKKGTKKIDKEPPSFSYLKFFLVENSAGTLIFDLWNFQNSDLLNRHYEEDVRVAATQTLMALKAYKQDTNRLPSSLNELVPEYLSSVPRDPYDEKNLKYSETKKIIYSVGKDKISSGGSVGDNWREMSDPTFRISF